MPYWRGFRPSRLCVPTHGRDWDVKTKILPARFYHCDPADLADELMAARQTDAAWEARRAIEQAMAVSASTDRSHRYRGTMAKRDRIQALMAAARKGKQ